MRPLAKKPSMGRTSKYYPSTAFFLPSVALGALLTRNFGCEVMSYPSRAFSCQRHISQLLTSNYGVRLSTTHRRLFFAECSTRRPSDAKLWSWGYVLPIHGIFAECSTPHPSCAKLGRGNKIGCILGSLRNLMSLGCTLCLTLSIFSKLPNLTNHSLLLSGFIP